MASGCPVHRLCSAVVRDLVIVEYVTLDGVIQAPGHSKEDQDSQFAHGGWTGPFMDDHQRYMREAFAAAGGVLLGRKTYEIFASYWPTVTDAHDDIARVLNSVPKYVVSTTLGDGAWKPVTVIADDVAARVQALKDQPGKDLLVIGSSVLAQTLMHERLVDEYQLWLHPVTLGAGKRLFRPDGPRMDLTLADARVTKSGLALLRYRTA